MRVRPRRNLSAMPWALGVIVALSGCGGPQSALDPAGRGAQQIAELFWWSTAAGALIWLATIALLLVAASPNRRPWTRGAATALIIGGGAAVPVFALAVLLVAGLAMLPPLLLPAPANALRIHVIGEQWWWRVRYIPPGGDTVELANEIRLPVGQPVEVHLDSRDVIHALWIPALGGKMDMIPGRTNRLRLDPTDTGTYRGVCAEYCGTSHALMAFTIVVEQPDAFAAWLARQSAPASEPVDATAARGRDVFFETGCGACHTIRGTPAQGGVGPDLTHVGGRLTIAAGTLGDTREDIRRWIAHTSDIKPAALMPPFYMLPDDDLEALAAYLKSLR